MTHMKSILEPFVMRRLKLDVADQLQAKTQEACTDQYYELASKSAVQHV